MRKWNELSMSERYPFLKLGVKQGIYNRGIIADICNKYAGGGEAMSNTPDNLSMKKEDEGTLSPYSAKSLVDAIYRSSTGDEYLGEPSHHYGFVIPESEADRLGYYPDERGHRDDRVKKVAHPSRPSRGKWRSLYNFDLTDFGMESPNYAIFGLNDNDQDPQAVLTYEGGVVLPEITVTPKGNYVYDPYDNINIYYGRSHRNK